MHAKHLTPILNVSDMQASFAWFEKFGWTKRWDWGTPATFGCVGAGHGEIFLCHDGQGHRHSGALPALHGFDGSEGTGHGGWIYVTVDDVGAIHRRCVEQGLEITCPPTDMPWGSREMHVRHPDGHVFRLGQPLEEDA